jgi:Ca2+:H+ antiporter
MAHPSARKEIVPFSFAQWRLGGVVLAIVAVALQSFHVYPVAVFGMAALALLPLASLLGDATEQLAGHAGAAAGGLLNATLGNLTELIIGIIGLWSGQIEVVKASITGSIVGNLLLVFGLSALLGGWGRDKQEFNRVAVGTNTSMLFLAIVALVMPALFELTVFGSLGAGGRLIDRLSLWTAIVLLASYFSSLVFTFRTHRSVFRGERFMSPTMGKRSAVLLLVISAGLTALASQVLVSQIGFVSRALGWTDLFIGVVIVAIVGNAAEHSAAILMARKQQMDLALNIAIGSSAQIALFVGPLLVTLSEFHGQPMSLVFHPLEIASVILSVGVVILVSVDGETHWFEGVQLLGVYAILAVFFYCLPATK